MRGTEHMAERWLHINVILDPVAPRVSLWPANLQGDQVKFPLQLCILIQEALTYLNRRRPVVLQNVSRTTYDFRDDRSYNFACQKVLWYQQILCLDRVLREHQIMDWIACVYMWNFGVRMGADSIVKRCQS